MNVTPQYEKSSTSGENTQTLEQRERLSLLFLSPTIWAIHFLGSYLTAAIWCAKYAGASGSLSVVQVAVGIYTLIAVTGIGVTGWQGYRRVSFERESMPHDDSTPVDRFQFLGFSTLLLSALSLVATLFVAVVFVFVRTCD